MRGALLGIELGTDLVDLVRAVVESIALEVAACLDVLRASVGPIDRLRLTGGGYAPPYPAQVTADFTGLPATRYADRDAALSGAMLLAGQAIGAWGDARQAAADRLGAGRTFTPVPGSPIRQADLRVRYERAVEAIRIFSHSSVERGDSRIEDGVPTRA
jgi:xylulokinase